MGRSMKGSMNVRSKGGKGSTMREMHHSAMGSIKNKKADHHPRQSRVKHQDPVV